MLMDMLRIFTKVYECQNFSRAAELLFISQPTISLKMKQLEQQLDVQLFVRQGAKSVQTTEQADMLYKRAKEMLRFWEETTLALQDAEPTTLTIACSNTFGVYYVPSCVAELTDAFPSVRLTLNLMNSEEAVHALRQDAADVALIEKPIATDGLTKELLFRDELVLAGSGERWLMREEHSGVHYFNELYLVENGLTPHKIYANNAELIRQLLHQQVGQTILPKVAVTDVPYQRLPGKYKRNMYLVAQQKQNQFLMEIVTWLVLHFQQRYND
ncbi:MAG: LysR family transcriptional regulator [Solibacillus sp.]